MKSNMTNIHIRAQTSTAELGQIDKLCFTTFLNTDFIPGAVATIRSIRKFYSPGEADIVVFLDRKSFNFSKLCEEYSVELQYFDDIASWALPLVYDDPKRLGDTTHYYHPKFQPVDGLPFNMDGDPGFDRIRHLHPLNVKAYCTGFCLCVRKYERVVHIDSDAFLLARIDEMFEKHGAPNSVIAFDDGYESLQNFERLFRMPKPSQFSESRYGINAGVVFYVNGVGAMAFAKDYMFYIESPYHYSHAGHFADQGVLRAVAAKHEALGNITLYREDAVNWNPTFNRANQLRYDKADDKWINAVNGRRQYIWHSAGSAKLWMSHYPSSSIAAAWAYVGGPQGNSWVQELAKPAGDAKPLYGTVLENDNYDARLCFTSCLDESFRLGAEGLVRSIRRLYTEEESAIVLFIEKDFGGFRQFCQKHGVELHYTSEIEEWLMPLVYDDPLYAENSRHYYHPDFKPIRGLGANTGQTPGFGVLHHLHPLNVKAYCTGYCLCIRNFRRVVHIDCDAFLLGRVEPMFDKYPEPNTVIGFDDGFQEWLPNLKSLYGVEKPQNFNGDQYAFNTGVIFYVNGRGTKELTRDFMFYIESCCHYTHSGFYADQGLLHAIVAKHEILGGITFHMEDGTNWNPSLKRADDLVFEADSGSWINRRNRRPQIIWHAPVKERMWSGAYPAKAPNEAWRQIGGEYESWHTTPGRLPVHRCELVANMIAEYLNDKTGNKICGLEIGTLNGRTSIAFCLLLLEAGFDIHIDTCDVFEPSHSYNAGEVNESIAQQQVRRFSLQSRIRLHKVGENENLIARFANKKFDFIYIDGSHDFKQVVADSIIALNLIADHGIIIGDDYNLGGVKAAVDIIFAQQDILLEENQWVIKIDRPTLRPDRIPVPV